jgi:peptidoglycan glycosyltransferase
MDRAIARLRTLFLLLFAVLAVRQLQIAFVDGAKLDSDTRNPRRADIAAGRGTIVARDGTPLALTRDGKRVYPLGAITAHVIGYASPRYGTAGLEDAFDRVLTAPQAADGPWAEITSLLSVVTTSAPCAL